jgi:hypothetical protein
LSLVSWSIKVSGRSLILFVSIILILIIPVVLVILVSHLRSFLLVLKPLILRGYFFSELRPSCSSLPVVVGKHPLKPHGFLLGLHETSIEGVAILGLTQDPLIPAIGMVVARAITTDLPLLTILVVRNGVEDAVIFKLILLVVGSGCAILDTPPIRVDKWVKRLGTLLP